MRRHFICSKKSYISVLSSLPILFIVILLILLQRRDVYSATSPDLGRYEQVFNSAYFFDILPFVQNYRFEPGFTIVIKIFEDAGASFDSFVIITQLFYFACMLLLFRNLAIGNLPFALLFLAAAIWLPTNQIMANNALRQAWAMSFMFLFLTIVISRGQGKQLKSNWRGIALIFSLSCGVLFHYSFIIIAALIIISLYLSNKTTFIAWIILIILYCLNLPYLDGLLKLYLYPLIEMRSTGAESAIETAYRLGFKINFFLMSVVPALTLIVAKIFGLKLTQPLEDMYRIYFVTNSFCLLLSLLPFHDRFFHYTWALIPAIVLGTIIELVYSYAWGSAKMNQSSTINQII